MRPLVILDLDGVLADTFDVYSLAVIEACQRVGIESVLSDADVLSLCDADAHEQLKALGASAAALHEIEHRITRALLNAMPWVKPVPLMPQLLDELGDAAHVVVFCRYDKQVAARFLHRQRVTGVAEIVGLRVGDSKLVKLEALRRRFAGQETCWHVVGTTGDVRVALRAGVSPCAVGWGWHAPEELAAAGAERLAATPPALLEIVAPWLAEGFWD